MLFLSVSFVVIILDQLIKRYVHSEFDLGESYSVVPNFFDITYVRNPGAAFGLLRDLPDPFHAIFFFSVPPLAVLIILLILRQTQNEEKVSIIALSAICGGALGNYIDRIRLGFVVDWLDFHYQSQWHYPAFNIADVAIVMGVGTIIISSFVKGDANKLSTQHS